MRYKDSAISTDESDIIFIRTAPRRKTNSAIRHAFSVIPEKSGYEKVYMPYGRRGKGFYYVKKR